MTQEIVVVTGQIAKHDLEVLAKKQFGDMVKGVVDIREKILALGGELHADEEHVLLDRGSKQNDLWGINIYPGLPLEQGIEFDSMINIRPGQGNRSRFVEDTETRRKIMEIVKEKIAYEDECSAS